MVGDLLMEHEYILDLPPSQDASHHQDHETFLVGNPELNLYLPLLQGGGGEPNTYVIYSRKRTARNLKMSKKGENISPKHQSLGSMFSFQGVSICIYLYIYDHMLSSFGPL